MHEAEQLTLPGLTAPISGLPLPTRFDSWETSLLEHLQAMSGLSRSEVIRRCVKASAAVGHFAGDDHLFLGGIRARARGLKFRGGRKARGEKVSELERTIRDHLRAAEKTRRALAQLQKA